MRRVRGPPKDGSRKILYTVPSREALSERLRDCYDQSRGQHVDLTEAEYAGCVYVLGCENSSSGNAELLSLRDHGKKGVPWWVAPARSAPARLYVGRAKDLPRRLWQHIRGAGSGGAHFTDIFVPRRLRRVFLYDRYDQRDELEGKVSQTIDRENEDAFVYSDRYDTLRGYKEYGDESGESAND